jgi:hypothetical protein
MTLEFKPTEYAVQRQHRLQIDSMNHNTNFSSYQEIYTRRSPPKCPVSEFYKPSGITLPINGESK